MLLLTSEKFALGKDVQWRVIFRLKCFVVFVFLCVFCFFFWGGGVFFNGIFFPFGGESRGQGCSAFL